MTKPIFLVIDGSYYLYRTFFGSDISYSYSGIPNNAIQTSLRTIRRVIEQHEPDRIAVVFDHPAPTFRHEMSDTYKAHRNPPPTELIQQLPYFITALEAIGIKVVQHPGVEGDDVVGTLAVMGQNAGYQVIISTGDKDMFQLVDHSIIIENSFTGMWFDREHVKGKLGIYPEQVVDYLALVGDAADGVAGVAGIGAKTASNLLAKYESIDGIIANLEHMSGVVPRLIGSSLEGLALDRVLTRIKTDVALDLDIDDFRIKPVDRESVDALAEDIGYVYGYRLLGIMEALGELQAC